MLDSQPDDNPTVAPTASSSAGGSARVRPDTFYRLQPQALPHWLLLGAVVAYALWFSWLTLSRFQALEARALDMGNLHQAIWNTAYGNWFHQTNQPGSVNRLSLHVEPILLPIAALFRLAPRVETLLILQSVTVALGALPLYALGIRRLTPSIGRRGGAWLALVLALGWLTMPAIQAANWLEFHPVTLAPTFFIAAFYFLTERRVGWYAFFALLAATCKEDLGLVVFLMGLYAAIAQRQWRLGAISMALGLGWSLFAVLGIQNSFGGNIHWGRYDWLGDDPVAIVRTLLTSPVAVVQHVWEAGAPRYLYELLLPVGFLAMLAPEVFLLALPSLGINLLADFPPMHEVDTLIYAAPIAPFVALGAVMGTARLLAWLQRRAKGQSSGWAWARKVAPWALAALLLASYTAAQAMGGYLPGGANARLFRVSDHDRVAQTLVRQIERHEAVSAQDKLNPHTAGRFTSYIYPRVDDPEVGNADVVFVDVTGPAWPQHPNDLYASVQDLLAGDFGIADARDGYLLLRRGALQRTLPEPFYTPWRGNWPAPSVRPPGTLQAEAGEGAARFGDALELLGVDVASDEHGEVIVRSQWRALRQIDEPLHLHFVYQTIEGERPFDSRFYPPVVMLWYPVTQWQPGETVLVTTLPWAMETETFALLIGVHAGELPEEGALPIDGVSPAWVADDGRMLNMGVFARAQQLGFFGRLTRATAWLPAAAPESMAAIGAAFLAQGAPELTLEAAQIGATRPLTNGLFLPIDLQWQVEKQPAADYNAFVHLLDAQGNKVAQWDGPPRQGYAPVALSRLSEGERLTGSILLPLPSGVQSTLTVVAGLYDWQTGAPLTLADGSQSALIGSVQLP